LEREPQERHEVMQVTSHLVASHPADPHEEPTKTIQADHLETPLADHLETPLADHLVEAVRTLLAGHLVGQGSEVQLLPPQVLEHPRAMQRISLLEVWISLEAPLGKNLSLLDHGSRLLHLARHKPSLLLRSHRLLQALQQPRHDQHAGR